MIPCTMVTGILVLSGAINSFQPKTVARFLALGIFINFTSVVFVVSLPVLHIDPPVTECSSAMQRCLSRLQGNASRHIFGSS